MGEILSITNQKGGVGKTTLTINLAAALHHKKQRVLVIDLDPQGHATSALGLKKLSEIDTPNNLHDVLLSDDPSRVQALILSVPDEGISLIPSNYKMHLADKDLFFSHNREHRLKNMLDMIKNEYDIILIDCPPELNNLTDNAINASRNIIIPIQAETSSINALEQLFNQVESIERGLRVRVRIIAVVPNLVQDGILARRVLADIRGITDKVIPFEFKKRVILQEAWADGRTIFCYQPEGSEKSKSANDVQHQYLALADIVLVQLQEAR